MTLIPFAAIVRKDLLLFFTDRRAVLLTFAVPIAIASFIGAVTQNAGSNTERARIAVAIADEDGSAISTAIVAGAQADRNLLVETATSGEVRERVRRGTASVGVVIPHGFGEGAGRSFLRPDAQTKPQLDVLIDPSRSAEVGMVRAIVTEHAMQALAGRTFSLPYTVHEEAVTARANVSYNAYAHSVAGMAVQFLLFAMANHGIEILMERQRGLWKRLRSAPVSRYAILGGKAASGAIIALSSLLVSFAFAMIVFGVRVEGSVIGFLAVCVACSLMAATLGILVAALGNSPATARGLTTFGILIMVMLGGAWVPMFLFPAWLQNATLAVPVRWAIDGLDAMTWRGVGLSGAIAPTLALLGFAAVFASISLARFRWEEA
jgi:ABC-2 type transport system permease protein